MPKKHFTFFLEEKINFKLSDVHYPFHVQYRSNHAIKQKFIDENREKYYNGEIPDSEFPADQYLVNRPIVTCKYAKKIIDRLKNEIITKLSKEYNDLGKGNEVYYLGNFDEPIIKSEFCYTVNVIVLHEQEIPYSGENKRILRYLSIELDGNGNCVGGG